MHHRPVDDTLEERTSAPTLSFFLDLLQVWAAFAFSAAYTASSLFSLSPSHPPSLAPSLLHSLLSSANSLCGRPFATSTPNSPLTRPPVAAPPPLLLPPALHLLFSPCVLPVAHDPAVQPKADCGAHTAGEAALGGALAQRTGASSASCSILVVPLLLLTLRSFSQT